MITAVGKNGRNISWIYTFPIDISLLVISSIARNLGRQTASFYALLDFSVVRQLADSFEMTIMKEKYSQIKSFSRLNCYYEPNIEVLSIVFIEDPIN